MKMTDVMDLKEAVKRDNKRKLVVITISIVVLLITVLVAISLGSIKMTLVETFEVLFLGRQYIDGTFGPIDIKGVVFNVRLPRVLCAGFIGAALAVAGAAMQGLFRNPMASPSVIGISSGAAFGACLSMVLGFSVASGAMAIPSMAFIFSFITLFLVYFMAKTKMGVPVTMLLLSGIAIGAFFSGLVSLLQYLAKDQLAGVVFWLMGDLSAAGWEKFQIIMLPIIIGSLALILLSKDLNLLSLGDDQAQNLGVNVERTRILILIFTALVVAGAVSISGIIGFVGLIVPHIFRMLLGPDHRLLLPTSLIGGAILMITVDTIARMILAPSELPVGIITALLGAPFFLYILRTRKKEIWGI